MLTLIPITEKNYDDVIDLEVTKDQKKFVASNMYSLAEAYAIRHLVPRAIMLDDTLIGFMMHTLVDEDYPRHAALWRLMIAPEHQGKGHGYEALQILVGELKDNEDVDGLLTSFEPENFHASRLYEKVGMRENGVVYDGEIITIMTWRGKRPETMGAFFDARHATYEDHMHRTNPELKDFYKAVGEGIATTEEPINILDIGCGTGMQMVEVLKHAPKAKILGIDLSEKMLSLAKARFDQTDYNVCLRQLSLFDYEYPQETYDDVVSTEAMHHFTEDEKETIYQMIHKTLKSGGNYIEADYLSISNGAERLALTHYHSYDDSERGKYHLDIPFTFEHQLALLNEAFDMVEVMYHEDKNVVFKCTKN